MPIYEYESLEPQKGCRRCLKRFEIIQNVDEAPLSVCPDCGQKVRKVISWCRAAVVDSPEAEIRTKRQIREYENQGKWSHAAELADIHSEKLQDSSLKTRALENYKKAGYNADSLERHARELVK